ncbi:retrovirus-related pol polyprotein from transposon tnt 1-94, partial [Phtheirospermum japonicum]
VLTERPSSEPLPDDSTDAQRAELERWKKDDVHAKCYMIASMVPELARKYELFAHAADIKENLESMYSENTRASRYAATKELVALRLREGASVHEHVLKMITLIEKLVNLDVVLPSELQVDLILLSLPSSYEQFIANFNMNKLDPTLDVMLKMLVSYEATIKKEKSVLLTAPSAKKSSFSKKWKSSVPSKLFAKGGSSGSKSGKVSKQADDVCHHCGKPGHWRCNCKDYLDQKRSEKGMYFIEVNLSVDSSSWVLDTVCGSHLCNDLQLMARSRRLDVGETYQRMGNGARVAAEAIRTVYLSVLNSDYQVVLNNYLYVPTLIRNLISIPVLDSEGFSFVFGSSVCLIHKDNKVICKGQLVNNLYGLNLNEIPINTITAKRKTDSLNPTQLWHARLGHISLRRMNEFARDGLFSLEDVKSLGTCESCLKGKMTKSPYKGQMEHAEDLLDLIHTDVCGPLSVSARGGYSYFVTFNDDYSRYGFVYLMKYKYETFERFKDFRHEVENQLGRRIKKLRSDRGGEYMSAEFMDYLKENGILSHWTPPGTPQLNGVSKRWNRTLLDMVRSMMGFTKLPPYLWGHALLTAVYLLNRVNTKAVNSTPYELWHSRKPSFKHIKIWGCPAYVKRLMGDKLDS